MYQPCGRGIVPLEGVPRKALKVALGCKALKVALGCMGSLLVQFFKHLSPKVETGFLLLPLIEMPRALRRSRVDAWRAF
jgi:hypothetical protein